MATWWDLMRIPIYCGKLWKLRKITMFDKWTISTIATQSFRDDHPNRHGLGDHEPSIIFVIFPMIYPVIVALIFHLIHWIPYNLTLAHIKLMIHTMDYYSAGFDVLPPQRPSGPILIIRNYPPVVQLANETLVTSTHVEHFFTAKKSWLISK